MNAVPRQFSASVSSFTADLERLGFSPLGITVLQAGIARGRVTSGQIALSLPDSVRNDDRVREIVLAGLIRRLTDLHVEVVPTIKPDAASVHGPARMVPSDVVPKNGKTVATPAHGKNTPRIGMPGSSRPVFRAKVLHGRAVKAVAPKEKKPVQKDDGGQLSSAESRAADSHRASDVMAMYRQEVGVYPLLTSEQETALAKQFRETRDREAYDTLIRHNLRLVISIARNFLWSGLPIADLVQYGNQGLMHAVTKYDHRKGFRLTTYATNWIRQSIYRGIEGGAYAIRCPAYMHQRLRKLHTAIADLAGDSEELPSPERIAEAMNLSVAKVTKLLEIWRLGRLRSLDEELSGPKNDGAMSTLGELTADVNAPDPMLMAMAQEELSCLCGTVERILRSIPTYFKEGTRNTEIFREFYGVNETWERKTLEAVGIMYGMTREMVRQITVSVWRRQAATRAGIDDRTFRQILDRIRELEQLTGIEVRFNEQG